MTVNQQEYHRASNAVIFGGYIAFIGMIIQVISFISPFWIESYNDTFSEFRHMGLWHYCFKEFRYPYYQFDKQFNGCYHVWSQEYYVIREWLLPGWLMVVQTLTTIAFLLSLGGLGLIAIVVIRWPLRFTLRYEWLLSAIAFVCNVVAGVFLLLGTIVFAFQASRRDWLMYPNFNHLSWSYAFAVVSGAFHIFAAFFFYMEACAGYKYRKQSRNLVMQMQPNPQSHHGSQRFGHL